MELGSRGARAGAEDSTALRELENALGTLRTARCVFLLFLILSLLIHAAAFSAVKWGNVLPAPSARTQPAPGTATQAAGAPAATQTADAAVREAVVRSLLRIVLPVTEFVGQVSCALLAVCYLTSALVCLIGGLGGVRGSLAAFFWILVLLALLFPWARWLGGIQVPGIYVTEAELTRLPTGPMERLPEVLFYARFLGYPALALVIALLGNARYGRAIRLVRLQIEARLQTRPM
jgi:hypothetical protein